MTAIKAGRVAVVSVNGSPAFAAWPRTDNTKTNPALVEFYLGGLNIYVISTQLGTNSLLAIAATIKPSKGLLDRARILNRHAPHDLSVSGQRVSAP